MSADYANPEKGDPGNKYYTAGYTMILSDIRPLVEAKKQIFSPTFMSPDDPNRATFKIDVGFRRSRENKLQLRLHGVSCDVAAKCKVLLFDDKNIFLGRWKDDRDLDVFCDDLENIEFTCPLFFSGEGMLGRRIFVEVTYRMWYADSVVGFDLADSMADLVGQSEYADVHIAIGEEKIPAHKVVLVARSKYFRGLFNSGMQESQSNLITFHDVSKKVFEKFLRYIYSGQLPGDIEESAFDLFPVADKYLEDGLKDACVKCFRSILSVENVIRVLILAHYHPCEALFRECIPVFKENVSALKTTEAWSSLVAIPDLLEKLLVDCLEAKSKKKKRKREFDTTDIDNASRKRLSRDLTRAFEDVDGPFKVPFDIVIQTDEGATLGAHAAILLAWQGSLNCLMKNPPHLHLRGKAAVVKEAIKFLYSDKEPENLAEIAFELLPLGQQLNLIDLEFQCVKEIQQNLTLDNVVDALFLARLHNCRRLFQFCLPIIKANVTKLKPSCAAKLKSDPDLLMEILADGPASAVC